MTLSMHLIVCIIRPGVLTGDRVRELADMAKVSTNSITWIERAEPLKERTVCEAAGSLGAVAPGKFSGVMGIYSFSATLVSSPCVIADVGRRDPVAPLIHETVA